MEGRPEVAAQAPREPAPAGVLEARVRQQEAVAKLGMSALSGLDVAELVEKAVHLVARTLSVEYAKFLELLPDGDALLVRAGVGWNEGKVGNATVGTNLESQAGYTLISNGPVVCENLREEVRFKGAPLLHDHGVRSGVTAAILVEGRHFGVIGAHTTQLRSFAAHEARFLQDVADVLGAAVERGLADQRSRATLDEHAEAAEAAERRFGFLAEANALLSASSSDLSTALTNAARLAVPALADWCFVDVLQEGGDVRRAAAYHVDLAAAPAQFSQHVYALDSDAPHGTARVLRTGGPDLVPEANDEVLKTIARDRDQLELLRALSPGSFLCVPLRVRQRTLGAMGFFSTGSPSRPDGGRYGKEDLALAEGLAHCAALAVDNALHHVPEARLVRELIDGAKRRRQVQNVPGGEAPHLTRRQLEVLRLLGEGRSAKQISRDLYRSEATVRNHIRAIKSALDARSQLEAIARARKLGLLSD